MKYTKKKYLCKKLKIFKWKKLHKKKTMKLHMHFFKFTRPKES